MKKKLLGFIFLAIAICLSVFSGTSISFASASELSKGEKMETETVYFSNVNKSIEIYDDAISPFRSVTRMCNVEEDVTYSDDYAGIFIDENGLLNIGVVGLPQTTSKYSGQALYCPQKYSYNYLMGMQKNISYVMENYGIYATAIDERQNKVNIYINTGDSSINHFLQENMLYEKDSYSIIFDVNGGDIENANTAYGGDKINDSILFFAGGYGTICVNAYDNDTGKWGVLTNEHVAGSDTMYHDGNFFQGSKIGTATKTQNGGTIDAAFVPFDNQNNWNNTTHARSGSTTYTNIKLGAENLIVQGAPVRKIGQTSGNTTGTITSTNRTSLGKTNCIEFSNASLSGDSGGPVYFDGGG